MRRVAFIFRNITWLMVIVVVVVEEEEEEEKEVVVVVIEAIIDELFVIKVA